MTQINEVPVYVYEANKDYKTHCNRRLFSEDEVLENISKRIGMHISMESPNAGCEIACTIIGVMVFSVIGIVTIFAGLIYIKESGFKDILSKILIITAGLAALAVGFRYLLSVYNSMSKNQSDPIKRYPHQVYEIYRLLIEHGDITSGKITDVSDKNGLKEVRYQFRSVTNKLLHGTYFTRSDKDFKIDQNVVVLHFDNSDSVHVII